jgi:cytidine deaminase
MLPSDWSESSRAIVDDRLLKPGATGSLAAGDVETLTQMQRVSVEDLMLALLPVARHFARPPLSDFHVGAVALGTSGALYLGANLEIGGNALNQAIHAEQSAIANAFGHRERGLAAIAVTAAPCGHCRQFMNEISDAANIRVIVQGQPPRTVGDLLPASFGPGDLGIEAGLLTAPHARLRFADATTDALAQRALEAASRSYAPHTKARSGCAIRTRSRAVYAGSYLENAAFNPSLSPLQSALVSLVFAGDDLGAITRVALVELRDASISQRPGAAAALAGLAPAARIKVHTAR